MAKFKVMIYKRIKYPDIDFKPKVKVDRHLITWNKLQKEEWEPEGLRFIRKTVTSGDIIFDIGTWIGTYSLLFSNLVGSKGEVVSFEPSPLAFHYISEIIRCNNISNVTVENLCITDYIGSIELGSHQPGNSMDSVLYKKDDQNVKMNTYSVNCITIDQYCIEKKIIPIGIKIDVEGAEGLVIRGARNIIESFHPWALIEFHGNILAEEAEQVWLEIIQSAKQLIYIDGDDDKYKLKDKIVSRPLGRFLMYVQY